VAFANRGQQPVAVNQPCIRLFFRLAAPLFALAWLEPKKGAIASNRPEYALPGARQLSLSS
jgi:hypothetical protein